MYIVDITTAANYFGRITGITRVEMEVARAFSQIDSLAVKYVYWSNDKCSFQEYAGPLEFDYVKSTKIAKDYSSCHIQSEGLKQIDTTLYNCFIVTGSGWLQNHRYTIGCIEFARANNLKLAFFVHDLIPILFPYYYESAYITAFEANLNVLCTYADLILSNSKNTKADLERWMASKNLPNKNIKVIYLGDEERLNYGDSDNTESKEDLGNNFILAVGAIHRRKNYELLTIVWRRLRERLGRLCPNLYIVGGVTQDGAILASEINQDSFLKDKVKVLSDVGDMKLERMYEKALLVVYPSRYEGWGLPVAEALARGKICIASNASAIPEIANLGYDSIDPDDAVAWTSRIVYYVQNVELRIKREQEIGKIYIRRTWSDTVEQIIAAINGEKFPDVPCMYPGDVLNFNDLSSLRFLSTSSYGIEKWGRWFQSREVSFKFSYDIDAQVEDVIFLVRVRRLNSSYLEICLNGSIVYSSFITGGSHDIIFPVPYAIIKYSNHLVIKGGQPKLIVEKQLKPWAARYADIGLISFEIRSQEQVEYRRLQISSKQYHLLPVVESDVLVTSATKILNSDCKNAITSQDGNIFIYFPGDGYGSTHSYNYNIYASFYLASPTKVIIVIRCNGEYDYSSEFISRVFTSETSGVLNFNFSGKCSRFPACLELTILDYKTYRPLPFRISAIWASQFLLDQASLSSLSSFPIIASDTYYKFGSDVIDSPKVLRYGWREENFGFSFTKSSIISFNYKAQSRSFSRVRLHCKVISKTNAHMNVVINGKTQDFEVKNEMSNIYILLPDDLGAEDTVVMKLQLWFAFESYTDGSFVDESEARFVLRGIQLVA